MFQGSLHFPSGWILLKITWEVIAIFTPASMAIVWLNKFKERTETFPYFSVRWSLYWGTLPSFARMKRTRWRSVELKDRNRRALECPKSVTCYWRLHSCQPLLIEKNTSPVRNSLLPKLIDGVTNIDVICFFCRPVFSRPRPDVHRLHWSHSQASPVATVVCAVLLHAVVSWSWQYVWNSGGCP